MDTFDYEFYIFLYEDIQNLNKEQALKHYLNHGLNENRICNKKIYDHFDYYNYINIYDDMKDLNKKDVFKHYICHGINEDRIYNKNFNWNFYINLYDDIKHLRDQKSALMHLFTYGFQEKRIYNKKIYDYFDYNTYILTYDDIKDLNKMDALKHYLKYGIHENRIYNQELYNSFDYNFYIFLYNDLNNITNKSQAFNHYIVYGINENRIYNKYENIYYKIDNITLSISYETFDNHFYTHFYDDLNILKTKKDAFLHWINNKDNEERYCNEIIFNNFTKFDSTFYLKLYNNITKEEAYNHWIHLKNNKSINNINDINNTFITFIIPTIGRNTLINTINSLNNLINQDWKAIIIFDGIKNNFNINNDKITIIESEKKGEHNKAGYVRNIAFDYITDSEWIGFVDDDDIISNDYICKLKEEIDLNKSIDVCLFRMAYKNNKILPNNYDKNISKCRVGISFAIKRYISKNVLFSNNQYEDYYYLKELEYKNYNIVISPYVCYYINTTKYEIYEKFNRIYI